MPFALYLLGLAVFAQGTSEFMLSGLLPDIAADLDVSVPAAGSLTSAFAVGMIVGAPLMAFLARRWSRRTALAVLLGTFLLVHVLGALTPHFGVLLATRVIGAVANAGFLAVALVAATSMVGPESRGRATSVLLGGTTLACVVGVPGGALLGHVGGWRSAFWAVALLSVPALVAIVRSVPAGGAELPAGVGAYAELRTLRSPRLLLTLLVCALANGAMFCGFTYLAPVVTDVTGLAPLWVPALLALFGVGSFTGVVLAGRIADAHPTALLAGCAVAGVAGWSVFALTAGSAAATIVLVPVLGAVSFALGSALIARALHAAAGAPTLAGALAVAALNVGAAVGPWLGGAVIDAGHGYRAPLWTSALLTALALATASGARLGRRRSVRAQAGTDGTNSALGAQG
ncbi:Cmx/CmrA family chloramphenicol efflux MFS transporter [Streptomyces sp. NPDC002992]|uniref:Cmx/CmrA family chloramphenicol efflux MFS transporter n=1 Tax=Streptomyces sp. NPDC002992 TaxID=3154273 RepID=UPI0033AAFAE4